MELTSPHAPGNEPTWRDLNALHQTEDDEAPSLSLDLTHPSTKSIVLSPILIIFVLAFSLLLTLFIRKRGLLFCHNSLVEKTCWRDTVEKKLAADKEKIPKHWRLKPEVITWAKAQPKISGEVIENLLDDETRRITNMNPRELIGQMSQGKLTAVQVVSAFCKRAAYSHQICDLLLEIGFDLALSHARECDEYFKKHGKLIGELHGLPFTMKDQFHIEGMPTSAGYIGWIGTFEGKPDSEKYMKFESLLVEQLKSLGAIAIGKSAVNNNNILGYAVNPHNRNLSTGGSSGGEAAMQALRGSCFGFGTDIGGSVSIPAAYQGVYSLKPSTGRISFQGGVKIAAMPAVVGIMGPSLDLLQSVFKSTLSTSPWIRDQAVTRMPWQGLYDGQSPMRADLAFGFLENDGIVTPHPPVARAMRIVKKAMEMAEIELVGWDPPSNSEVSAIHVSNKSFCYHEILLYPQLTMIPKGALARGDGCLDVWQALELSGEPLTLELERTFPDRRALPPISVVDYQSFVVRMIAFRERWNDYWESSFERTKNGHPVEAIIAPVTPHAGIKRIQTKYSSEKSVIPLPCLNFMLILPGSAYATSLNVLDYPGIGIPITFADQHVDEIDPKFKPLTSKDADVMRTYDPGEFHGSPISIQLIGRRQDEERLFAMAKIVQDAVDNLKRSGVDFLHC
ncbi:unnamed protein product [Clonostachys solani]|uniref:Amidase domain-containing protein n=1 Tax=Clonostachys solani TaxID=160281 RepID=A0A9N9YYR8_9HYPO|nr:unnamed protein product [Clonostachys solani]